MQNSEKDDIVIFKTNCSFILKENDKEVLKGKGEIQLKETELILFPELKESLLINYRDIVNFYGEDYRTYFNLTSGEVLLIYDLGYKFEDFLRVLSRLYNEVELKDFLMKETLRKSVRDVEMIYIDSLSEEKKFEKCEIRLYETGIVLIPEKGELKRLPYSDIEEIKSEDYKITINTEFNEKFILSMFGKNFEPFLKSLSQVINELSLKVQESLKELLPDENPSVIRKISNIMKEGKAAKREDIELISGNLWEKLENKILSSEIKEEYEFLKSMGEKKKICIGLKRGLLGELTGEYIWFLIPIYGDKQKFGNAIAMEAISGEEGGKATYFFRIMDREKFIGLKNFDKLNDTVDDLIKNINRCMLVINFRREPIYLPDEKLKEPRYQKYLFSIKKIPQLQILRNLYIGRVIHSSFEQWKNDVEDLLLFNIKEKDENKKWKKS